MGESIPDAPDAGVDGGADGRSDGGDDGDDADGGDDGDDADGGDDGGGDGEHAEEPPELEGILEAHNAARADEGADLPPLTWDPLLAAIAQEWAERCESSDGQLLDHNLGRWDMYDGTMGENIVASALTTLSGSRAVKTWMDEKPFYDHATRACSGYSCAHYTQVVWRDTLRVGCASVYCDGLSYPRNVVCNYAPAGNTWGEHPY